MKCPYCESETHRVSSLKFYGMDYGTDVIVCNRFPVCDAYVGCHKSGEPMGTLANESLRRNRNNAHAAFDPLWKEYGLKRKEAYALLAQYLDIPVNECHIALFDENQCRKVIGFCIENKLKGVI